jgi:hypothetical protein
MLAVVVRWICLFPSLITTRLMMELKKSLLKKLSSRDKGMAEARLYQLLLKPDFDLWEHDGAFVTFALRFDKSWSS